MVGDRFPVLRTLLALLLAALVVRPAYASDGGIAPTCLASAPDEVPVSELLDSGIEWKCSEEAHLLSRLDVDLEGDRVLMLFANDGSKLDPKFFVTRLGQFDRITMAVREPDGGWNVTSVGTDDVRGMATKPSIIAPLPVVEGPFTEIVVAIDKPSHEPMALNASVVAQDPSKDPSVQYGLVLIAILLGMVLLPIVFDITFLRVLRHQFLIWHMAMAASFGLLLSVRSGIINVLWPVSLETWRFLLIMALTAAIVSSLMFMRSFIEPGKLANWTLRVIPWVALASIVLTGLHALSIPMLRPVSTDLHMVGVVVPYVLLTFVILQSVWRRSRAGMFVFVGWLPIMTSTWGGIITHLTPIALPSDMLEAMYIGMLTEMIATAAGVGDRFMALKRERDIARAEADKYDALSNSDPLTGLLNRRAIDAQFEELRGKGFDTFALVDLDHFKRVNDSHGHDMGDTVLCAVARVLARCQDCVAFRLGGEEFLLLMRGDDSERRAEALRQSMSVHIAREVEGLEHMVTASIGLVVVPQGALPKADFNDIYRYADRMLYEAKETGRNRMVSERLRAFRARGRDRRKIVA